MAVLRENGSGSVGTRSNRGSARWLRCTPMQGEGGNGSTSPRRAALRAVRGWAVCRCSGTRSTLCVCWAARGCRVGMVGAARTVGFGPN
jgi:hypothetical protein